MERSRKGVLYVKDVDYLNRELQDQISLDLDNRKNHFFHHTEYDGEFKPPAFCSGIPVIVKVPPLESRPWLRRSGCYSLF